MKTYVINLERAVERRKKIVRQLEKYRLDYELIEAIDGRKMSDEELNRLCDLEAAKARPQNLTIGALGCALSHLKAYEKMLADNANAALILEDDAVLPAEIGELLDLIENNIQINEVILLHYFKVLPEKTILSRCGAITLNNRYSLLNPIDFPFSGTAYVIKNETARALTEIKLPIRTEADDWRHFYENGGIESLRCVYPKPVMVSQADTQIQIMPEYNQLSWRRKIFKFIRDNKIPGFYRFHQFLLASREKYAPPIALVEEPSRLVKTNKRKSNQLESV